MRHRGGRQDIAAPREVDSLVPDAADGKAVFLLIEHFVSLFTKPAGTAIIRRPALTVPNICNSILRG